MDTERGPRKRAAWRENEQKKKNDSLLHVLLKLGRDRPITSLGVRTIRTDDTKGTVLSGAQRARPNVRKKAFPRTEKELP